jgi:hypothetical protein
MDDLAVAKVLEDAADVLLTRGWTQGAYHRPTGEVCLSTALRIFDCSQDGTIRVNARAALSQYLGGASLTDWNDDPERTEGEVRDALLHTAKDLRNRAGVVS